MMKKKRILAVAVLLLLSMSVLNAITLKRVSIHDPSVVWEPSTKYYYLFGTHRGLARSKDMMNWNTTPYTFAVADDKGNVSGKLSSAASSTGNTFSKFFVTNMTKTVTIGGVEQPFGNFDAYAWSAAAVKHYGLDGNMWAPDIVYNKKMQKWCLYFSINGESWASSIVLLTADNITGPYVYQGPVVFSGFGNTGNADLSYKKTDLELALGEQKSLPSRYNRGKDWGNRYPNCIDPCVFYDEDGTLWMSYGSWSGGIWMLRLNEDNGLRDYDVKYPSTGGSTDAVTSDPYFGTKIAGGCYVSGEGSYIEYINGYYYLFVSYGFMLSALPDDPESGGYQMRVFRSEKPDGPYKDNHGNTAVFTSKQMNYGPTAASNRGVNIFGAYSDWGNMSLGEREQGHNSIIAADDGRTYLVYHTRFQDETQGHAVRVHQVFQNEEGWLVAAPFEYTGEKVTSADIAATQQVPASDIPGTYRLLTHKFGLNYTWGHQETATPTDITLHADGTISGSKTGKWNVVDGTSYVNLTIGGVQYKGVMVEQVMETNTTQWPSTTFSANSKTKTVAFTALAKSGVTVWGYRSGDDPTGITPLTISPEGERTEAFPGEGLDGVFFDLQGRCVTRPGKKGVYIHNGRKYILK